MSEIAPLPIEFPALLDRDQGHGGGEQHVFKFGNGYGASVVRGPYTYGGPAGKYELAVIRFNGDGDDDWDLTYQTPITDNVLGWLEVGDIADLLVRIAALESANA